MTPDARTSMIATSSQRLARASSRDVSRTIRRGSLVRKPWLPSARSFVQISCWGLLILASQGCLGRVEVHDPGLDSARVTRFIEKPTEHQFSLSALGASAPRFSWRIDDASLTDPEGSVGNVSTRGGSAYLTLSLPTPVSTSSVDALVIDWMHPVPKGRLKVSLRWRATPRAIGDESREFTDTVLVPRDGRLLLRLQNQQGWKGDVSWLQLKVPTGAVEGSRIRSVSGVQLGEPATTSGSGGPQNWRVTAGHDSRNAVLVSGTTPLRWSVSPDGPAVLTSAAAVLYSGDPVVLTVIATVGESDPVTMWEQRLEAAVDPDRSRWVELRADIPPAEGRAVDIMFEVRPPVGGEASDACLVALANPEMLELHRAPRRPNLLLVSLDTARADRMSTFGYTHPTTPNLTSWAAARAVVFEWAIATAPRTLPSHTSIFTGMEALRHGVNQHDPVPSSLDMLAERLRAEGYQTMAVTGGGVMRPEFGFAQGFDIYRFWSGSAGAGAELENGIASALELLDQVGDRPFFMFFHTYEPHDPYVVRSPYSDRCFASVAAPEEDGSVGAGFAARPVPRSANDGFQQWYEFVHFEHGTKPRDSQPAEEADLDLIGCLYDASLSYSDQWLKILLERVDRFAVSPGTLTVILSDHGESLGEEGRAKHAFLHDTDLHVPLIVALPTGEWAGARVTQQVSLIDVRPTILDILGLEDGHLSDGKSLVPKMLDPNPPSRSDIAWSYAGNENRGLAARIDNRTKLIFNDTAWYPSGSRETIFDLQNDPGEQVNLAVDNAVERDLEDEELVRVRDRLQRHLEELSSGIRVEIENSADFEMTGEIRSNQLRITDGKTLPISEGQTRWLGQGRVEFTIRPGETWRMVLQNNDDVVALDIRSHTRGLSPALGHVIGPLAPGESWSAALDETGWVEPATGLGSVKASVKVSRFDPLASHVGGLSGDVSGTALDQLQALGYVE